MLLLRLVRGASQADGFVPRAPLAAALLALHLAAATGTLAAPADDGKIVAVRARLEPRAAVVEVVADRPLSFTTLRLQGPPRVVLDLADAHLGDVPAEQRIEDGTVLRIAAAQAGERTARIVVELAADAEFDVSASGASLDLRIARTAPAVAGLQPPRESLPAAADEVQAPLPESPPAGPPAETTGDMAAAAPASLPTVKLVAPVVDSDEEEPEASTIPAAPMQPPSAGMARLSAPVPASITGIGFRPPGAVIVHVDRPLGAAASDGERAVVVRLPGARIPLANNRRPLDTRYFGGPIARIVPLQVPGGTEVRIELRERAAYALHQDGGVLTVTFTR